MAAEGGDAVVDEHLLEDVMEMKLKDAKKDPLFHAQVRKVLGDGTAFQGVVEGIDVGVTSGDRLYRIKYEDGDLEHMTGDTVRKLQVRKTQERSLRTSLSPPAKRPASPKKMVEEKPSEGSISTERQLWQRHGAALALAYAEKCRSLSMPVDPSVATWLRFGGSSLSISGLVPFEGCLLPMYEVLAHSTELKRLSLHAPSSYRDRGAGNSNARVLRYVLLQNTTLEVLDLRHAGIDQEGLADLCEGLRRNRTLRELSLQGNFLGHEGGRLLTQVVQELIEAAGPGKQTSLRLLDVSYCSIGSERVQQLALVSGFSAIYTKTPAAPSEGAPFIDVTGNFETEELWNSITHFIMFLLSFFGSFLLLYKVADAPLHHIWGCILFCFGLLFCFASSTLYHSFFLYPKCTAVFQVLDHIGIYVLIAASYSPFLLFYPLPPLLNLLSVQWLLCFVGVVVTICAQYADWGTSRLYMSAELGLYLCMGWGALAVWDSFTSIVPGKVIVLVLAGGVMYTAGVPFFIMADYRPLCHIIWHLFVAAAAILHWFAVKDAAADALEHHAKGPFGPRIEWWNERYSELKDEFRNLQNETQDHGLVSTLRHLQQRLDAQAGLLQGLAALSNISLLEKISKGAAEMTSGNSTSILSAITR